MTSCNFKAPNGAESILYKDLELNYGPDKATQIWNYTQSKQFQREYEPDLDQNEEPTFEWMKENLSLPVATNTLESKSKSPEEKTPKNTITLADFGIAAKKADRIDYLAALDVVKNFYEQALQNPGKIFKATDFTITDLKKPTSNGYTPIELAGMFAMHVIPDNVKFDPVFEALIANTSPAIMQEMTGTTASQMLYPQESLNAILEKLRVPVRDKEGNKTGNTFTAEQERAAVETIVSQVRLLYAKDENVKLNSLLGPGGIITNNFIGFREKFNTQFELPAWITPERSLELGANYEKVINSWKDFTTRAIIRLEALGLKLKDRSAIHSLNSLLENSAELETEEGRGLRDWSDSSFELDPKDTASTRVKLFLASIRDVTFGTEREPSSIDLTIASKELRDRINGKNKIAGRKTLTIRTAEQAVGLKVGGQYITKIDSIKHRVTVQKELTEEDLKDSKLQAVAQEEGVELKVSDVLLKLEEWRAKKNTLVPKENFLGFAELVDFDDIFQKLLETLYSVPNTLEDYLEALETEGKNFKPVFQEVANRIRRESVQVQNEFVRVMSKQYQEFSILLHNKRRDGLLDSTAINANQGSAVQSILKQWRENQKNSEMVQRDSQGNLVINESKAKLLAEKLEALQIRFQNKELPNVETELRPFAEEILHSNGIVLSDAALDYLLSNTAQLTKKTALAGGVFDQFKVSDKGLPIGIFSSIVMKLAGITEEEGEEDTKAALLNNNPLYTENTAMQILARLAYRFSPKVAAGSHYDSENKNIYAFGMNSFLSNSVRDLIQDPNYRQSLLNTHLGSKSWLLKQLQNSPDARDHFKLQYVDGLKEYYKKNAEGVKRPSMSTREQLVFAMGQFQHQRSKYGNFISLTHSEKATTPLFTGILKFNVGAGNDMTADVQQAVWETFLGEYERVKSWYTGVVENKNLTKNDAYNKGGGLYYFIPQFNYDQLSSLVQSGAITPEELQLFWIDKGVPNTRTDITELKPLVTKLFQEQWLQPEIERTLAKLKSEGFLTGLVDYSYMKKNISKVDIDMSKSGTFYYEGAELTTEEAMQAFLPWATKDFVTNYFLVHTALSSLIFGDPALMFKGKEGMNDQQMIAATMQEYQKRLAGPIAPGEDPSWELGDTHYKAITLKDDERVHTYLNELAKYNKQLINGTDAQELVTVAEHLYVMKSMGLIKDSIYNEMVKIIEAGQKKADRFYEFVKPEHLAVVMQIMKPVQYSHDFTEVSGTAVTHYIKSSAMPLYPSMTANFEIDQLRQLMEKEGIQRANFVSAKKVGTPAGGGFELFDKDGNIHSDFSNISPAIQVIPRSGLRIQQEVPYDEFKDEILTGSQMNKLFVDDIMDKKFTVDGKEVSGAELKNKKEAIRKQLITMQVNDFSNRIGAELIDNKLRIIDKSKFLDILEDEAVARNYSPNDILMIQNRIRTSNEDGANVEDLAIPLFFNPSADRFEALIMSLVKKVGQIYMPGKSYIQASSAGFKFKDKQTYESLSAEDKNKIVWTPGYNGEEFKTMTPGAPAQVLISWNFIIQNAVGVNETANIEDYLTQDKDGNTVLDTTKVPEELLELLAFRIPTQKQNSMLPVRVAGFLPTNMADVIVVPEAITRQMGSDFDVDKLYVYRRGYNHNQDNTFSKSTGDDKAGLVNQYFDIAWTVLTSPNMYETVMQPLDTEDLKLEAQRAAVAPSNFYSPLTALEDYTSQTSAAGPMRGITSQFVTFNSWVQDQNLKVGSTEYDENQEVEFDEFAQPIVVKSRFTPDGIKFVPEGETKIQHAYNLSGKATSKYINEETGEVYHSTRMDNTVTVQNETLDHAKNRVIDKVNINLTTIHAAEALIALASDEGETASWKHGALLLRQPAIVQLVQELSRSADSFSTTFETDLTNKTIERLINQWVSQAQVDTKGDVMKFIKDRNLDVLKVETLLEDLTPINSKSHLMRQAGYLLAFKRLNDIGKEMAKIQKVFNQDPKGPGKNMIEAFDSMNNLQRVIDSDIISGVAGLVDTEQGFIHEQELKLVNETVQDILPYAGLQAITYELMKLTGRKSFSIDAQREIVKSFKAYVFSNPELGLSNHAGVDRYRLLYGNQDQATLAKRVWDAQQTSKNYFLNRLQPQLASTPNTPSYVFYQASKTSALDDQENMAAFVEGLKDPSTKELFEDLVRYAYVTGGYGGSFNFIRFISADFLSTLPFAAKLREVASTLSQHDVYVDHLAFMEQWLKHNPQMAQRVTGEMIQNKEVPGEEFKLKYASIGSPVLSIVEKQPNGYMKYPRFVSFYNTDSNSWNLFKQSTESPLEYRRVDTLGNNQFDEYTYNSTEDRSILADNRALIRPIREIVRTEQTMEEKEITAETFPILRALEVPANLITETGASLGQEHTISLLADLSENDKVEKNVQAAALYVAEILGELQSIPISLEFKERTNETHDGIIDIPTGHIKAILDSETTVNSMAAVLVHEAVHSITSLFTHLPKSEQSKYATAAKALERVKEVQIEAQNAVRILALNEKFTIDEVQEAVRTGKADDSMLSTLANLWYLTSSVDEFLSGIFESKELQALLNMQTSQLKENKTILQKVVDLLAHFLKVIGEAIGLNIRPNSTLEVGLKRSFEFTERVRKIANKIATRPGDIKQVIADTYFNGKASVGGSVWQADNLDEAKRITKEINSEFPMYKAEYHDLNTKGIVVAVENRKLYSMSLSPKEHAATNPIDKVYGKVQEQMSLIRASIAQNKKSPDVLRQNQLLASLRLLANDLKATQDLERIKDLMRYQLAWARKARDKFIDKNLPVSINQIMTGFRLVSLWADMEDSGLDSDKDFVLLKGEARVLADEYHTKMMWKVFQEQAESGVSMKDLVALKDMPAAEAQFLDLSRAESRVTQEVALTINNTHRKYLEEGQALLKEIAEFDKEAKEVAKSKGLKTQELFEKFMHSGADWGLRTQYSPEFHKWKAGLRNRLSREIEDAEENIGDPDLRSTAIRKAYDRYWRGIGYNAGFISAPVMFENDGTRATTPAAIKYRQEMVDEYGEAFTDKVLASAHKKYNQYLDDQEQIFEMYDTQVEEGLLDAEEANEAKAAWDLENSPIHKLNSKTLITTGKYLNIGERYLELVPHKDAKTMQGVSFFDSSFDEIQNDESLKRIYDKIQEFMQRFIGNLPYYVGSRLGENFLAAIHKNLVTSIADVPAYIKGAPGRLLNDLTASSYDEFMQKTTNKHIPISHTENPFADIIKPAPDAPKEAWDFYNKQRKEQAQKYTRDLPRILELFGLMSLHYKNFSEARDAIELGEEVIKKADADMRNGNRQIDRDGKVTTVVSSLKNTLGALAYTKDVLMFKRAQNLQGPLGQVSKKIDKSVTDSLNKLKAKQEDLEIKFENNEVTLAEYIEQNNAISSEMKKYETRRLYGSKIGDKLITWTQLKAISYNPLSAINNLAFGLISAIFHANGKQDYNMKEFRQAFTIMLQSTGRSLGLARITGNDSAMHKTAEKILNIMDRMNIMGELTDTAFKSSNLQGHKTGVKAALQPYQMLRTGDYFVKGLVMVAMLKHHKIMVDGVETDAWKEMTKEGTIEHPDVDWNKVRNKIIAVNKIVMGNQDKSSPIWAKKNILFRLLGQFRLSWLSEGIASRFEGEREDIQLGRTRKGRYRTYADLGFFQSIGMLAKQTLSALPGVKMDPYNNARLTSGKHFTDTDKANMRRNLSELAFFLLLFGASKAIGAMAPSDDPNRKKWFVFWMNMATRSYQDVALYSNPSVLDSIIGTPAPALGTIRDTQKFITATIKWMTDSEYTSGQWFRKLTRAGIVFPQTTLFNRFETMTNKDISTIQR